jgi:hypothetical protein
MVIPKISVGSYLHPELNLKNRKKEAKNKNMLTVD